MPPTLPFIFHKELNMENQPNAQSEPKSGTNQPAQAQAPAARSPIPMLIIAVAAVLVGYGIRTAAEKFNLQMLSETKELAIGNAQHAKVQELKKKKKAETAAPEKAPEAAPAPKP